MTARKRDMAISQTILAEMISDWIDQNFDLPLPNVPDLHELEVTFQLRLLVHWMRQMKMMLDIILNILILRHVLTQ